MVKFAPLAAVAALAVLAQGVYAQPESYDHDKAFLDAAHSLSTSHGHKIRVVMQDREDAKRKLPSLSELGLDNLPGTTMCGCVSSLLEGNCCAGAGLHPRLISDPLKNGVQARDFSRRAHDDAFMAAARGLVATSFGSHQERTLVQVRDDKTGIYSTTVCNGPIENCKLSVGIA